MVNQIVGRGKGALQELRPRGVARSERFPGFPEALGDHQLVVPLAGFVGFVRDEPPSPHDELSPAARFRLPPVSDRRRQIEGKLRAVLFFEGAPDLEEPLVDIEPAAVEAGTAGAHDAAVERRRQIVRDGDRLRRPGQHGLDATALGLDLDPVRHQEVDVETLGGQLDRRRRRLRQLALELVLEGVLGDVGVTDESAVEVVQRLEAPDRPALSKQRIVAPQGVVDEELGGGLDELGFLVSRSCHISSLRCEGAVSMPQSSEGSV